MRIIICSPAMQIVIVPVVQTFRVFSCPFMAIAVHLN